MDEENKGFAIPSNRSMFGEGDVSIEARPLPQSDVFMAFGNDAGDKAVLLTAVETVGDEVLERHGRTEMENYAKTLMDTGEDPMELQIGNTYEGENALADAEAEAFRLDEEFNPGEGASDGELAMAVDAAKADVSGGAASAPEEPPFPDEGVGADEALDVPDVGADDEAEDEEPEDLGELEGEPMLDQLNTRKRPRA